MLVRAAGQVGPQTLGDGVTTQPLRQTKDGSIATAHALGRYEEMARRGTLLTATTAALAGIAVAAANASPLAAGTGQPIVGLFNPINSAYDLVIMRAKVWTVSGTPGGPFGWNVIPANAGITAAGAQGRRNDTFQLDGPAATYVNVALTGSALATFFRVLGGQAAVAATGALSVQEEETAGDIVVLPGAFAGIAATAAGTTHQAGASITYALRVR